MLNFIVSNLATIIVGTVVLAAVAFVVIKMIQQKNKFSCCSCGCNGCQNAKQCGHDN